MFLKHLVCDGLIAVVDPELNRVAFHVTEQEAEAWIQSGKIVPVKTRRRVAVLHWAGPKLTARDCPELQEFLAGGHDVRHKDKYSFDWKTDFNPENVWTHCIGGLDPAAQDIPATLNLIFLEVALSMGSKLSIASWSPDPEEKRRMAEQSCRRPQPQRARVPGAHKKEHALKRKKHIGEIGRDVVERTL